MAAVSRLRFLLFFFFLEVLFYISVVDSIAPDFISDIAENLYGKNSKTTRRLKDCTDCNDEKDNFITTVYTDASGDIRTYKVQSSKLSSSWSWGSAVDEKPLRPEGEQEQEGSSAIVGSGLNDGDNPSSAQGELDKPVDPLVLKRKFLRESRRKKRVADLAQLSEATESQLQSEVIERSRKFNATAIQKYSLWRREYQNPNSDSTLRLMRDQIIMAEAYASIARSQRHLNLADSLMRSIKQSLHAIGKANSDAELRQGAVEHAKEMGRVLTLAKDAMYDCNVVARKLRAMLQNSEENVGAQKRQGTFLIQHAAKTISKPMHCLPLQLTADYHHSRRFADKEAADESKLVDPSLYHYAIFSDNVLATSVVVNSTALHARDPEKHVFHVVTDRMNYPAMKAWFAIHPPQAATVHVESIDSFKWLNSSYCSVLRQLESARLKDYYFKANHPSTFSAGHENLKYRNPKYLSMLNHLRFYMPEVYPKLDKILFLDDDVVVQRDLTPLWSVDLEGMVNGAIETCKDSFHRFETYLNFSDPRIAQNFDPQACGWAFGMNIFDLKEWKLRNITKIYHYWQDQNEDRQLWKLGSLPPGLITFYNLTKPLERTWHVLGLGYDPSIDTAEIEGAGVIHYNGNYKPWLDLAITKYKAYWSKYVMLDNPHIRLCGLYF